MILHKGSSSSGSGAFVTLFILPEIASVIRAATRAHAVERIPCLSTNGCAFRVSDCDVQATLSHGLRVAVRASHIFDPRHAFVRWHFNRPSVPIHAQENIPKVLT
jgi:hypothetical protein